jgi:Domain of unknown function (DUF4386)
MNSTKKTARIAGALYLVNGVTGFFSIIYVPSKLFVSGNAGATADNILASERLFRLGIASEVICAVEYIYLLWVLYRLLSGVSKTHASLMVIFGVAFVPIMCMNAVSGITALALLRGVDFPPVFNQPQRANPWPCCSSVWVATGTMSAGSLAFRFSISGFVCGSLVSCRASWARC